MVSEITILRRVPNYNVVVEYFCDLIPGLIFFSQYIKRDSLLKIEDNLNFWRFFFFGPIHFNGISYIKQKVNCQFLIFIYLFIFRGYFWSCPNDFQNLTRGDCFFKKWFQTSPLQQFILQINFLHKIAFGNRFWTSGCQFSFFAARYLRTDGKDDYQYGPFFSF